MVRILLALGILSLIACNDSPEPRSAGVYFAGEIVNPTAEDIVLYKGDKVIDSVRLDAQNRFEFNLEQVEEGLHHFYHHPELQYVFIEKGDSLQIRLNTVDFDESLVFSGSGEEINNFMVSMFLLKEQEEEDIYSYYRLEPEVFKHKIDSLRHYKVEILKDLDEEGLLSEQAFHIAKATILYNSYIYTEAYPFYHRRQRGEVSLHDLPADFYQYRQSVNYSDSSLTYLRPYYNFMKYHLGNLSFMSCKSGCDPANMKGSDQLHFNQHKLVLIDSLIQQKDLRDNLFRNVAVDYLLKHDTESNCDRFIDLFHKRSGNNRHIAEINTLYEGIKNMRPDRELPDVWVHDFNGEKHNLKEVAADREVVFYFWSGAERGHFNNISRRITELKKRYPQYTFIGINLRTDHGRWKSILETNNMSVEEQFWADDFEEVARTLIVYDPNKGIIAKNGLIVDAFANVYNSF